MSLLTVITTLTSSFKKLLSLSSGYRPNISSVSALKPEQCDFVFHFCFIYINHARAHALIPPVYLHVSRNSNGQVVQSTEPTVEPAALSRPATSGGEPGKRLHTQLLCGNARWPSC